MRDKKSLLTSRNNEIIRLRKEDPKQWTLQRLGEKYGLQRERIRQITTKAFQETQYTGFTCKIHKEATSFCRICKIITLYKIHLNYIKEKGFEDEIQRLSKPDRRRDTVIQRALLIKQIKAETGFSNLFIASLFGLDPTTIRYFLLKKL